MNTEGIENAIQLKQTGEIESRLAEIAEMVGRRTTEAIAMVATEETLKAVRAYRSELKKDLAELESQRKAVKTAYMAPYNAFEAEYKRLISDPFNAADRGLKAKINAVESDIKGRMEEEIIKWFTDLKMSEGLSWLEYSQVAPKIGLTDAKGSGAKLKRELTDRINKIEQDCEVIATMDNSVEIMAEYQKSLNLTTSIAMVNARKEAERRVTETFGKSLKSEVHEDSGADVENVKAKDEPLVLSADKLFDTDHACASVYIYGTDKQIASVFQYMDDHGISYKKGYCSVGLCYKDEPQAGHSDSAEAKWTPGVF